MFEFPLLGLLGIPLVFYAVKTWNRSPRVGFSSVPFLGRTAQTLRARWWFVPQIFFWIGIVSLLVGLMGPFDPQNPSNTITQGHRMALVIDRSGSMALEVPVQGQYTRRIDGVKNLTEKFLKDRIHDQISLISFARYPETHTPLTDNKEILLDILKSLNIAQENEDGTSIGDAIALATARLQISRRENQEPGIIILLTDGQNNQGKLKPSEAAELAQKAGVRIYAIGLKGQGTLIQEGLFGPQRFNVQSDLDEETLGALAQRTGGKFYALSKLDDLGNLYKEIESLETSLLNQKKPPHRIFDLTLWLLLALTAFLLDLILRLFVFRRYV